ncbi:sulfatase family protein [Halosimplex salinum]|uniref:sulfatase family protein n=1 Tax=Halosimplex salinum TaxID=1710538 RepID=UPI000F493ACA|nr:sulfatase-like hydrolase/transferase [Halosimplex salinum]
MATDRPNVLFVCIDALRSDFALGEYGSEKPFFEFFEREGTVFDTTVAAASSTTPCVASYMTGTYPPDHGVLSLRDFTLDRETETLAEVFDAAGYATRADVTGPITADTGLDTGFDSYDYRRRDETVYTDWFEEFKRDVADSDEPWFQYLHLWEAHVHRDLPPDATDDEIEYDASVRGVAEKLEELLEILDLSETVVAVTGDHGESIHDGTLRHRASVVGFNQVPIPLTGKRTRHVRKDVYDRYLEPRGIELEDYYNSLRRFSAVDFPNAFHRVGHSYHVYDFLTRVPFVLAGPGVPAGRRVGDQVRQVDVFPTLLSAAGLDASDDVSGQDLLDGPIEHRPAYLRGVGSEQDRGRWLDGVRYDGWKFVKGRDRNLRQLFDLEADPEELHNVIDDHPDVVERLEGMVDEHVAREGRTDGDDISAEAEERMTSRLEELGYL